MAKVRGETVPKLDAFGGDVAVESWVLCEKVQTMKSDELHRTCEVRWRFRGGRELVLLVVVIGSRREAGDACGDVCAVGSSTSRPPERRKCHIGGGAPNAYACERGWLVRLYSVREGLL